MLIRSIFNIIFLPLIFAVFHSDRQILVSKFSNKNVSLSTLYEYQQNFRYSFLKCLENLSQIEKMMLKKKAALEYESDHVKQFNSWAFLEYSRTGSRISYEEIVFGNVRRLSLLVIGHLLAEIDNPNTELYLDVIFSETYRILELTTWIWPAHIINIPSKNNDYIDLGAGEMAKHIAFTKLLMYPKFVWISKGSIIERIDYELEHRIFRPYVSRHFYWDGLEHPKPTVNNWNIWINANILKSAVITMENEILFSEILERSLKSVDAFLNNYGDDGGCEEGPAYWREAGGRLGEYLETLSGIFPEANEYYRSIALLKEIGDYSWKLRISGNWFVNFADATPEIVYPPWYIWNYAKIFDDQVMKEYSSFMLSQNSSTSKMYSSPLENFKDLNDFVSFVQIKGEILQQEPNAPEPETIVLPELQIIAARSDKKFKAQESLFLAAKMGTNYESHSQNDVGSFVLFQNGLPALIDIGVGVYNSKTFSSKRYEIFYMQSRYHNCPAINGFDQKAGHPYGSSNVTITNTRNLLKLEGYMEQVYPSEAHIISYHRKIEFDRVKNRLVLQDNYKLAKYLAETRLHFITVSNMLLLKMPYGLHMKNSNGVDLKMYFKWSKFNMEIEFKNFENDTRLTGIWGQEIQHFSLITKSDEQLLDDELVVVFQANKSK